MNKSFAVLVIIVILIIGVFYYFQVNRRESAPVNLQRTVDTNQQFTSGSGLIVSVNNNSVDIKDIEGNIKTYTLNANSILKKSPHPSLLSENQVVNLQDIIITSNDLKENDKVLFLLYTDGTTVKSITVLSENPTDFQ